MADTATTVAIIGAAATVVAAIGAVLLERAFRKGKKARRLVVEGSGSAGATSGSRGTSVATSSSGGSNITLVSSPGATVLVPPAPHPASAPRNPSDGRVFVREESTEEIVKVLSAAPPLERRDLARSAYVGRWARWAGIVSHISHDVKPARDSAGGWAEKKVGFKIVVIAAPGESPFFVSLPESERAAVELLREGDMVEIEGKLDEADGYRFWLSEGRIISHTKKPSDLK